MRLIRKVESSTFLLNLIIGYAWFGRFVINQVSGIPRQATGIVHGGQEAGYEICKYMGSVIVIITPGWMGLDAFFILLRTTHT